MEHKSFGILLVDFIDSEAKDSVDAVFKKLCKIEKPRTMSGIPLGGGGGIQVTKYGKVTEVDIPPEFECVELSLVQESRFIVDVYCYGILKEKSIEGAESNTDEVRSLIDRAQHNLNEFIKPHASGIFSKKELGDHRGLLPFRILHIDPEVTNPFKVIPIENKGLVLDEESVDKWIKDNNRFINVLGFNTLALMSKKDFALTSKIPVYGDYRFGFVVVSFHGGSGEEFLHPTKIGTATDIVKMLRIFYWSNLRVRHIELNRKAIEDFYKNIKKSKTTVGLSKKLEDVDTIYSDIVEWQVDLLSLLARIKDEIEHFKIHLHNLNAAYSYEKRLNMIEKEPAEEYSVLLEREAKFDWKLLLHIYEGVKIRINDLENKLDIIDERQRSLVGYAHDFVNTLIAVGNVNLQKEIRNLTMIAVFIALVALAIAVFSNTDKFYWLIQNYL